MATKPRTNPASIGLPPYMEARPMKSGGTSYRLLLPSGTKIALGWNLNEALDRYKQLRPTTHPDAGPNDEARILFVRHQKGAKSRGIAFDLTLDDVVELMKAANGRCSVSKKPFSYEKRAGSRIRPWAPSIDRRDATAGYTKDNCRIVCAYVNVAMNQFGEALFMELIEAVVRRVVREELASGPFKNGAAFPSGKELAKVKPQKTAKQSTAIAQKSDVSC